MPGVEGRDQREEQDDDKKVIQNRQLRAKRCKSRSADCSRCLFTKSSGHRRITLCARRHSHRKTGPVQADAVSVGAGTSPSPNPFYRSLPCPSPLFDAPLAVQIHVATVLPAAVIGAVILARPKGTPRHRRLGRIWFVLMIVTALSSFFIHSINMVRGFSPIHLISAFVLVAAFRSYRAARRGDIRAHRSGVVSMYVFGIGVAGFSRCCRSASWANAVFRRRFGDRDRRLRGLADRAAAARFPSRAASSADLNGSPHLSFCRLRAISLQRASQDRETQGARRMEWKGRRQSDNIEDRRGDSATSGGNPFGRGGMRIPVGGGGGRMSIGTLVLWW